MKTKPLSFTEAIEYCEKKCCDVFALNEKECETFIFHLYIPDEGAGLPEIDVWHSKDGRGEVNWDPSCGPIIENCFDIEGITDRFPHIKTLEFHPFDSNEWDADQSYYIQKEHLLKGMLT